MWEHLTLPLLLLPQRSRWPSVPLSPGVVATNWCNASLGTTLSGKNCKPTNQRKRLKEVGAIKIQCNNIVLVGFRSNPPYISFWWLICSKLRHHAQHGLLAVQEAPHSCVFYGAADPGNCFFMKGKDRSRFLLYGAWPALHCVLLCENSSCRGSVVMEAKVYTWERPHGYGAVFEGAHLFRNWGYCLQMGGCSC